MNFQTDDLTKQVAQTTRDFALQYIKPHVMTWDENQEFPVAVLKALGKLGLMGVVVPETYGGSGMGYFEYVAVIQELAKVCGSIGLSVAAHNSLCTGHILAFGNEKQKNQYLPKLASAEWIGSWGLTEANTGSDAGNMGCIASRKGDDWVINGTKCWITHGISSDLTVVVARTGEPRTRDNATAFVVERGTPGFYGGKKENKLGMRASETSEMIFDNCIIPDANRLERPATDSSSRSKFLTAVGFPLPPWQWASPKELSRLRSPIPSKDSSSISRFPIFRESPLSLPIWQLKSWRLTCLPCRLPI